MRTRTIAGAVEAAMVSPETYDVLTNALANMPPVATGYCIGWVAGYAEAHGYYKPAPPAGARLRA